MGLIQIAVDRSGVIAVFLERFRADIDIRLAIAKDDGVGELVPFAIDQFAQDSPFFAVGTITAGEFEHHHALLDGLRGCGLAGHLDPGRILQKGVCDPLNLRRHCGGEKEGLAGERGQAENALNIGDEPHVEHAVRLIHDHDFDVREDQPPAFKVIEQSARRGNQNIHALVDDDLLFLETHTADQQRLCQFQVLGVGVKVFSDLRGQFAGGAEHQRARHPGTRPATGQKR